MVALTETYEVNAADLRARRCRARQAILKEMAQRPYNPVLGAERRSGVRLYFSDTAATLLKKSPK